MPTSQIAAQLYTVRDFTKTPTDIAQTLNKVKQLGYDAVQCSALGPIETAELKRLVDGEGLSICATHADYERMRTEPQSLIDEHQLLGCKYVAISSMPGSDRSAEGFARFAKEASEVAQRLAEGGLVVSYHNHSFELERFDGRTGLEILCDESNPDLLKSELDTYWIQHGGGDPAAWIRKLKGRIPTIHVKDMEMQGSTQLFAEVGEGNLNWSAILEACKEASVEWYIVEQDTCQRDPFESLGISLSNLKGMGVE